MTTDKTYQKELILSLLLASILIVFINPFGIFISIQVWMTLLSVFVVFFAVFSILVWNIKALDEREEQHITFASRVSFFVGSGILTLGIIYQSFTGTFDYWLAVTLLGMILAKVFALYYARVRH